MKTIRLVVSISSLLLAAHCLHAGVPNPGSEGKMALTWSASYQDAVKKAETDGKPIVMDVTTDWCGWSKKMDRETFADAKVQEALKNCVLIRLNPESSDENRQVAEKFKANSYPTLIIANFKGEMLAHSSGYQNAEDFLAFLNDYLPAFKKSPLGYSAAKLQPTDPLLKAVTKIPGPNSMPNMLGSFLVLDQSSVELSTNGTAKIISRTSYYIVDPEREDLPLAQSSYNSSREKVRFSAVRILNTKGEGRELDVSLAKDEHAYSNQNVYWDVRTLSLTLPPYESGQIVDIVEERDITPVIPNQFFFRWFTGAKMILSGDLKISFPASLNLQKRAVRCMHPVLEEKKEGGTVVWTLLSSNPRAFEPEIFAPSFMDMWEGYEFATPSSKDVIASWFQELCKGRDVLPEEARARVTELKTKHPNQAELLQAVFDWVTKNIRYVGVHFGSSSHQPHAVSETLKNLYGDCKDQALLLQAMCRQAGIPTSMIIVGAGTGEFDENNPAVEQFNHCILEAMVDGQPIYLDPSAGPAKIGQLPITCCSIKALKVTNEGKGEIISLPAYKPREGESTQTVTVKLQPNGSAVVTEVQELQGQRALQTKLGLRMTTVDKIKKYLEETYKNNGQKLLDFSMTDPNEKGEHYRSLVSYTVDRFASVTGGGLVFKINNNQEDARWMSALNAPRTKPFRFFATDPALVIYEVELPAGSELKSTPQDLSIESPFLKVSRKLTHDKAKNRISIIESTRTLDARMDASQAVTIQNAFRQVQDHREYAFILGLPQPLVTTP